MGLFSSKSSSPPSFLFVTLFILIFCVSRNGVFAFGAGNIPSFAYLEGKAFRHGDIEDVLEELAKGGSGFALGKLIGRHKFGGLDIKRVYFGNWLRDYSQAVDIATLKKLPLQTIVNLCMVLGFLAHGYATHEFEVTPERLGCYLPTEHIDNPKGYGDGEDPRKYHPGLRGPVDPRELEVDPRTGMKNFIANEFGSWDTSKALARRTLERCIHLGRQHKQSGAKADLYESYRLLGQALHTLEDFPAHSNFCEISLVAMGHTHVFQHVGDNVRIQAPNGRWVAPIVTGTFGGDDFYHSLLGEAGDKLSQASVSDLNAKVDQSRSRSGPGGSNTGTVSALRELFSMVPGDSGREMSRDLDGVAALRADGQPGHAGGPGGPKPPDQLSPQELHAVLWKVLTFRDSVSKKIEKTIEKIPGLGSLLDKIGDGISVFVFTTLEPYLKPLIKNATSGLTAASTEVINSHDQFEVFNDPNASDPTHSFLSKDHFNLILNEPAGNMAKIIVKYTVNAVTKAWSDPSVNVHQLIEDVLQCLFHPDFSNNAPIQQQMLQYMHQWVQSLGHNQHKVIGRLSKESVRAHKNVRSAGEGGAGDAEGSYAHSQGVQTSHNLMNYVSGVPVVGSAANFVTKLNAGSSSGGGGGHSQHSSSHGGGGYGGMMNQAQQFMGSHGGGHAASFFNTGGHSSPWGSREGPGGDYPPPSEPPPFVPSPPQQSGYAPSYAQPPGAQGGGYPGYGDPSPGPGGFAPPPGPPGAPPGPGGFGFPQPGPGGFGPQYPGQQPPGW